MNDYYKSCAFPKPDDKKKHKKMNGYKDKPNRVCFFTGRLNAERHEVFPGTANRQISIDNGFQIDVCPELHRELQENITPWAKKWNRLLKMYFQKKYELKLRAEGVSPEQAREAWISLIGRNYIHD